MGKLENGLLRGVRGLVGPIVVAKGIGVSIVRIKGEKTSKPPKQSQVNQRNRFKRAIKFVTQTKSVMSIGYQYYTGGVIKPLNAAMRDLLDNGITGVSPDYKIDFPNVQISKSEGGLKEEHNAVLAATAGQNLTVSWDAEEVYSTNDLLIRNLDKVMILLYNETNDMSFTSVGDVTRAEGTKTIHLPRVFVGGKVHGWMFFSSAEGNVSNSQYMGFAVVLA